MFACYNVVNSKRLFGQGGQKMDDVDERLKEELLEMVICEEENEVILALIEYAHFLIKDRSS